MSDPELHAWWDDFEYRASQFDKLAGIVRDLARHPPFDISEFGIAYCPFCETDGPAELVRAGVRLEHDDYCVGERARAWVATQDEGTA